MSKTYNKLKEAIDKVAAIDVEGFDNAWVLHKFARDQALINISLIKPYTDKYALIVRYLMTGDESIRKEVCAAANAAYSSASDVTAYAAANSIIAAAAHSNVADVTAYVVAASVAAYASGDTDYSEAITMLNEMVDDYIAILPQEEKAKDMTVADIEKALGYKVKVVK